MGVLSGLLIAQIGKGPDDHGFPILIAQCILQLFFGYCKIIPDFLGSYGNHLGHKEKSGQAMVHRMEFLRNMPDAFRMGAMGMGVKKISLKLVEPPMETFPTNSPSLWGSIFGGGKYHEFTLVLPPVTGMEISKGLERFMI